MPVEFFPPVMNMARYFSVQDQWEVSLCTNRNYRGHTDFDPVNVCIVRGTHPTGKKGLARLWAYLSFHLKSTWHLVRARPDVVFHIEPHSALPVYLARLFGVRVPIFIHCHEYHRPSDFSQPGMRMAGWLHRIERLRLYPVAKWISQTNASRLQLFLHDHPGVNPAKLEVLPNYPPSDWWEGENRAWTRNHPNGAPVRLVYVGSLSLADTFIEDVVAWVRRQATRSFTLDIYSYNMDERTRDFLRAAAGEQVHLHENGAPYDDLPGLLRGFHAGLILYKGNTPNYVHNATNKLFEYLACGLDVIYSRQIVGVKPYATSAYRPRVIECDFRDMVAFQYEISGRSELPHNDVQLHCESALARLEAAMLDALPSRPDTT